MGMKAFLMLILKCCAKLLLVLLVCFMALHFLMTCSPVPLFHIERLRNARRVVEFGGDAMLLANRQRITLPHINGIPTNEIFRTVVSKYGVEVDDATGRVYGLIKVHHWCGNDPVRYDRRRIDLSAFAGTINPDMQDNFMQDKAAHLRMLLIEVTVLNNYPKYGWNSFCFEYMKRLEDLMWKEEK